MSTDNSCGHYQRRNVNCKFTVEMFKKFKLCEVIGVEERGGRGPSKIQENIFCAITMKNFGIFRAKIM